MDEFETIADLFAARARELPGQTLFIQGDRTMTYGEADDLSGRVAHWLSLQGIKTGMIVASFMQNTIDHALIWLGCAKLGAIFAATNASLRAQDLAYTLGDLDAEIVFTDLASIGILNEAAALTGAKAPRQCVVLDGGDGGGPAKVGYPTRRHDWSGVYRTPTRTFENGLTAGSPAGILYTGGSTGMPKGVLLPHGWYISGALRFAEFLEPAPGDVHMGLGQLYHANGTAIDILGPVYCRMTAVISAGFSATKFWETVDGVGAKTALMVGPMISILVGRPEGPDDAGHALRRIIGGTGQIAPEIREAFQQRFGVEIIECYAQTESGPLSVGERPDDRPYLSNGSGRHWTEIRIVDDRDRTLAPNKLGQICIRPKAPNTAMLGYHNKPEMTVAVWKDLWFHTGDLGYLDDAGRLHFKGRHAHAIRRRGENISAFEIEKIIATYPGIEDVAVVGVPSELGEEEVKAYIQMREGVGPMDPARLIDFMATRVAKFKLPRYVEFVDSFPRSSAKQEIERHVLRSRGIGVCWDAEKAR